MVEKFLPPQPSRPEIPRALFCNKNWSHLESPIAIGLSSWSGFDTYSITNKPTNRPANEQTRDRQRWAPASSVCGGAARSLKKSRTDPKLKLSFRFLSCAFVRQDLIFVRFTCPRVTYGLLLLAWLLICNLLTSFRKRND